MDPGVSFTFLMSRLFSLKSSLYGRFAKIAGTGPRRALLVGGVALLTGLHILCAHTPPPGG